MNSEEKIAELTKRIEQLESAEKKRKIKKKIKITYEITKILIVILILLGSYLYINAKVIKPYQNTKEIISETVNDKFKDFESTFNEKIESIKGWFRK